MGFAFELRLKHSLGSNGVGRKRNLASASIKGTHSCSVDDKEII